MRIQKSNISTFYFFNMHSASFNYASLRKGALSQMGLFRPSLVCHASGFKLSKQTSQQQQQQRTVSTAITSNNPNPPASAFPVVPVAVGVAAACLLAVRGLRSSGLLDALPWSKRSQDMRSERYENNAISVVAHIRKTFDPFSIACMQNSGTVDQRS